MPARGSAGPADEQGGQRRLQLAEPPEDARGEEGQPLLGGPGWRCSRCPRRSLGQPTGQLPTLRAPQQYYPQQPCAQSSCLIILAPHTAILSSSTVTLSSITVATVTLSSSGTPGSKAPRPELHVGVPRASLDLRHSGTGRVRAHGQIHKFQRQLAQRPDAAVPRRQFVPGLAPQPGNLQLARLRVHLAIQQLWWVLHWPWRVRELQGLPHSFKLGAFSRFCPCA